MLKLQRNSLLPLTDRYGDLQQFMRTFDVGNMIRYTEDEQRAVMGNAPTFFGINSGYQTKASEAWLCTAWAMLSEYAGNQGKLSDLQIKLLAQATVSEFGWLKITEFMLFMRKFMSGKYSRIFGKNVDPLKLTDALREFVGERNEMIARYTQTEHEEQRKREQEEHPPITWEEYCRGRGISEDNPFMTLFK